MKIKSIRHRGLKRFIEKGEGKGLPAETHDKIRKMVSFLEAMADENELKTVPIWRAHQLKGLRKGAWSLTVLRNYRLTFMIDDEQIEIIDLDYEDYH